MTHVRLAPGRSALKPLGLLVLLAAVLTAAAPSVIQIRRGDTLSTLAARHHTTVAALQALNGMQGRTTIYAGTTLRVPGTAAAAPQARVVTSTRTYSVRPGDGLIVLARRFATTPTQLMQLNNLKRTTLFIGEQLRYPVAVAAPVPSSSTVSVPGPVAHSAAVHRAALAVRSLPSKSAVQQMIRLAARRHGVPASLALALAYQESGFQQRVVSPVDAIGAMQVLPRTGHSLGRLHGRTFDLLKASDNVEAGVILLKDLLRATGSVEKALAGYYQGLGSISRKGLLPQTTLYVRNVQLLQARFA